MNDDNVMTNHYSLKDEPVKVMDAPQAVETWHEVENKDWHEQVTTPETVVVVEELANPKAELSAPPVAWLKGEEVEDLQSRWKAIQIEFVDEPRKSVEQADALVVEALKRIEQAFTNQRTMLNERWLNHEDIQT